MKRYWKIAGFAVLAACWGRAEMPRYVCQRAEVPPVIDGKLDDAVWQRAFLSAPFADISEPGAPPQETRMQMVWDDDFLYIAARMAETNVWATLAARDSIIYHDPDFEVFIDAQGKGRNYIELEINALNTVWDLFITRPYGHEDCVALHDWDIKRLKHAVHVEGSLNNPADTDQGWSVELAIPWESITGHSHLPRKGEAPKPGSEMRMNFSRVSWEVARDAASPAGVRKLAMPERNDVWAPTGAVNIHKPEKWGVVRFSERAAGVWETAEARPDFQVYLWVHGNDHPEDTALWRRRFFEYREAGVDAVIADGSVEALKGLVPLAREAGLSVWVWLWALNQAGNAECREHPDWYSVSREGKSCFREADRPYVAYYEFLCPTHPQVRKYLKELVGRYAQIPGIAGIQLDYIRMVDVILPRGLWKTYGLVMDRELPPYDFCYCPRCIEAFGRKPLDDPSQDEAWREFRLQTVAEAAAVMAEEARRLRLPCAAAVFPSPELASALVRQDWKRFPLDLALPMNYSGFYNEPDAWIGAMTREAREAIGGRFPIAPGLHLPDIAPEKLEAILDDVIRSGGEGIGLFCNESLTPERQAVLKAWKQKREKKQ